MRAIKEIYLRWKCKQILLEMEQLVHQLHHSPELEGRINELDLQLKSITEYLND